MIESPIDRQTANDTIPARILIVDDDSFTLETLARFLRQQGYQPFTAENGKAALTLCQKEKLDIILMDANMPELDGFQTCRKIKKITALQEIPIIMVTGLDDEDSVTQAFASGAEEYITKPVNWAVLRQRLRLLLAHQKAEAELREFTTDLAKSNRDLEDFAYVVSHDLKEPVNLIQAFCRRLKMRCGLQLDEHGHEYLRRINSSADRMQQLIDGLLSYARITTSKQPFTKVALGKLTEKIVNDLDLQIKKLNATVTIKNLPTIEADQLLIDQLFRNLLSNSLKYQAKDSNPLITITGTPLPALTHGDKKEWEIKVKDNGLGFDNRHCEKIFTMFQRLEHKKQLPGTGIGLAICRRITEHHQGTIRASSIPGYGSEFFITLPERQSP